MEPLDAFRSCSPFFTLGCVTFLHTFILMMEHSTVVIVGNVFVILLTFEHLHLNAVVLLHGNIRCRFFFFFVFFSSHSSYTFMHGDNLFNIFFARVVSCLTFNVTHSWKTSVINPVDTNWSERLHRAHSQNSPINVMNNQNQSGGHKCEIETVTPTALYSNELMNDLKWHRNGLTQNAFPNWNESFFSNRWLSRWLT